VTAATAKLDERLVTPGNAGVPTQVANPSRASWRTFVQSLLAGLAVLNIAVPIIAQFAIDNGDSLADLLGPAYPIVIAILNAIIAVGALVAKLIALLMANPIVNAFIVKHLSWLAPIAPKEK